LASERISYPGSDLLESIDLNIRQAAREVGFEVTIGVLVDQVEHHIGRIDVLNCTCRPEIDVGALRS
jgi:hypothetical protein